MTRRAPATLLVSASLIALAACQDSATKAVGPLELTPTFSQYPEFANDKHIMKTKDEGKKDQEQSDKDQEQAAKDAKSKGKPSAGTGILYHGGPVLLSTNVAAVYWASAPIYSGGPAAGTNGSGDGDGSLVGYFLRNLGGSSYFNINSTYTNGAGTHIANVVNYTQYWANNTSAPAGTVKITDAQMIAMLQSGFDGGKLAYDANTIYAIFTEGKVNLGGGFGSSYCAYHTYGTVTVDGISRKVIYAAMPYDYAYPGSCTSGTASPNGDPAADGEVNTLAHEIEEATTDPYLNAWYDQRGYENADKCAWTWGTTSTSGGGVWNITVGAKHFLVQRNWVNSGSGGCYQSWP